MHPFVIEKRWSLFPFPATCWSQKSLYAPYVIEKRGHFFHFRPRANCKQLFCLTSAKSIRVLRSFWETSRHFVLSLSRTEVQSLSPHVVTKKSPFCFYLSHDWLFIYYYFQQVSGWISATLLPKPVRLMERTNSKWSLGLWSDQEWWMSYSTINPLQITTHNIFFWSPRQEDKLTSCDNLMQKFMNFWIIDREIQRSVKSQS